MPLFLQLLLVLWSNLWVLKNSFLTVFLVWTKDPPLENQNLFFFGTNCEDLVDGQNLWHTPLFYDPCHEAGLVTVFLSYLWTIVLNNIDERWHYCSAHINKTVSHNFIYHTCSHYYLLNLEWMGRIKWIKLTSKATQISYNITINISITLISKVVVIL